LSSFYLCKIFLEQAVENKTDELVQDAQGKYRFFAASIFFY